MLYVWNIFEQEVLAAYPIWGYCRINHHSEPQMGGMVPPISAEEKIRKKQVILVQKMTILALLGPFYYKISVVAGGGARRPCNEKSKIKKKT